MSADVVYDGHMDDPLSRWLAGIPPNWSIYLTYWERSSVRSRSRTVTRRKQRRQW